MTEMQPLLHTVNKLSVQDDNDADDNRNNKQLRTNSFFHWLRCFSAKEANDKYIELDNNDAGEIDTDKPIGILQIFRFADRIDVLLMSIAVCLMVVDALCFVTILVLFGRLAGIFAIESFTGSCQDQHQISAASNYHNNTCPLGIELNPFSYAQLHRLCNNGNIILSSTSIASIPSFRAKVMNIVHWLFILGTFNILCFTTETIIWTISSKRQTSRMNVLLFRSLLQRSISYLDTHTVSRLNAKLFSNIQTIDAGIGLEFIILFETLICMVGTLVISFVINWQLTLIMLCITLIVIAGSVVFSKITANETMNELNSYSKAEQIVQEVFSSLRTVLSLNGSQFEQTRYEKELQPTRWSSIRKGAVFGIFMGWISFTTYIVYSVGFISGSFLMSYLDHNRLSISDILVIVSIFAQCLSYFSYIGVFFRSFSEARGAAASVFRLIDEADDTNVNERDLWKEDVISVEGSIYDIDGDIEFENVNFNYPSRQNASVLRNLTLIARTGQTTALVGSSGCGKSTCISLLLRYYEPSSGQITIDSHSITDYRLKTLRQNIGIVSQEPILFAMSIYENIRFGKINATQTEIEEAARQANAHNFIMQLPNKYETLVGERGVQLSGGEKQRVALARALVKKPSILLLDEATSALDNVSEKIVQEALDRACKNRTTIVIAHRLTTIQNADHIYVLDNGCVIEEGTHKTLMAKEGSKYQTMVESQQMQRINDDSDDIMGMEKGREENEQLISDYSRLIHHSQDVGVHKKTSTSSNQKSIFLRLLYMNNPEWIAILIGCIACVFNGAAQPMFAVLLAKIVNAFNSCTYSEQQRQVWIFSFLFLLVGIILLILRFVQYTAFAIVGSKLTQRIRSKAFASLLRQEVAYFDRSENSSGAICARLSSDALAVQEMTGTRLGVICEALALSCFGVLFGIFFSWQLTMIVFLPFLILIILTYLQVRLTGGFKQQSNLILERASTFVVEVIHNMRTFKQLSIENEVLQQYSNLIHQIFITSLKVVVLDASMLGLYTGMEAYVLALLYWRALVLVERNELVLHNIIMVFAFAIFTTQSIKAIGMLSTRIGSSISAAQNFFDLFDRAPTIDNASTEGQKLDDFRGDIEFNQVKFIYPARPASIVLNKFRLSVKSGQRVALVGESGCGKSTIIQLLERFYDVTHGQLFLDGIDIRQLNINWIRSRFGLVSQEPILFDLTIAENIRYGLENVPLEDIINAATKANIHQFIQQLPQGYETKVGMKGSFLSGGEKQRIAIARVLLRRPKILLLDEATSALDSHNEEIVQQALEQAQIDDPGRTSLIIAHRLLTIRSCDLICVLSKGHIVESGTHMELIQQRGLYYSMLNQNNL